MIARAPRAKSAQRAELNGVPSWIPQFLIRRLQCRGWGCACDDPLNALGPSDDVLGVHLDVVPPDLERKVCAKVAVRTYFGLDAVDIDA
jgi:hypothetical protein